MRFLLVLISAALMLGSETWPHNAPASPLAGFSFSPQTSTTAGRDPAQDLKLLLEATDPDVVRLPIYWEEVEPTPDRLDFKSVDALLEVIETHNATSSNPTRVVLTVGARNFLYPELHMPYWAGPRQQPFIDIAQQGEPYRIYFDSSITRYRASPLLYAWQVENEPLDNVVNDLTGDDQITPEQLSWEMDEVHRLDPNHQAIITTYDGLNVNVDMVQVWAPEFSWPLGPAGHPQDSLTTGDALGLDLYIDGPNISYRHLSSINLRATWKQQAIHYWSDRANKQGKALWLAEMQAQPWGPTSTFTPAHLITSAIDYRQERLQVALLWGVDTWLTDPSWLSAGARAMQILRD
ncbi:MAG TPA: hypothetical protein VLK30_07100 [Candidatus Limnocylindrales bacterium]|nr:hypothetical protein [Candidatus Limnocylindrales bacterium]